MIPQYCILRFMIKTTPIRRKRSDTHIGTVEKKYGIDFGVRSDMKLGKFLKESGFPSLSKALDEVSRIQKSQRKR